MREGIMANVRFNAVVETGVPGFIPGTDSIHQRAVDVRGWLSPPPSRAIARRWSASSRTGSRRTATIPVTRPIWT